jgi:hypothetical protein
LSPDRRFAARNETFAIGVKLSRVDESAFAASDRFKSPKSCKKIVGQNVFGHFNRIKVIKQNVVGQNVVGQNVVGQNVVGQNVVGQNVVGQNVVGTKCCPQNVVGHFQRKKLSHKILSDISSEK